jgi:four helix bundle protein
VKENELCERLFNFAVDTIKFLKYLKSSSANSVIKMQLTKAATSSGANYEEAQGASSKADFVNKVRISLKEMREANYWLRILQKLENKQTMQMNLLVRESVELKNILGSICKKQMKIKKIYMSFDMIDKEFVLLAVSLFIFALRVRQ